MGHSRRGAAVYVADSLADAALQAAHPTAVFQDGRGRYFRLASEEQGFVRPEQLGWTEGESHSGRIFTEAFEYQAAVAGRRGDAASGVVELTAGRTYRLGDLASRPHGGVTFTGRSFLQPGNRLRGNGATLQGSHALGGSLAMAYSEVLSIHPVVGPMAAGERTFQLETPDDAQAYAVGDWVKWRLGDVSYDPPETFNSGWARVQQVDTASGEITLDRHIRLDWDGTGTINRHLRRLRPLTGTVYEDLVLRAPTESSHDNLVYGVRIYDGYGVKLDNITGFNCGAGTIVLQDSEAFHVGSVAGHANPRLDHGS